MTSKIEEKLYRFWWLHDGAWYQNCAKRFGFPIANEMNKEGLRYVAQRFMQSYVRENRIKTNFSDIGELVEHFMRGSMAMWPDDWCEAEASILSTNTFEVILKRNFALDWVRRAGTLEQYECPGIALREGWFAGLAIKNYQQEEVECMVKGDAVCRFRTQVEL